MVRTKRFKKNQNTTEEQEADTHETSIDVKVENTTPHKLDDAPTGAGEDDETDDDDIVLKGRPLKGNVLSTVVSEEDDDSSVDMNVNVEKKEGVELTRESKDVKEEESTAEVKKNESQAPPKVFVPYNQRPNLYEGDDSDDPVVEEMDVFLSQTLADNMYIFQYPLRGELAGPFDTDNQDITLRMKPKQEKVEMTVMLNTQSDSYNFAKALQIADLTATEKMSEEERAEASHFPEDLKMDRYWLTSTRNQIGTHYCVGLIVDGQVHLTPVKGILQMRPDMSYLDPKPAPKEDDSEANEAKAKAVNVRVQTSREKMLAARKAKDMETDEDWVGLSTFYRDHHNTDVVVSKMVVDPALPPIPFPLTADEYVETLSCVNRANQNAKKDAVVHPDGVKQSAHKIQNLDPKKRTDIFNLNLTQRLPWVEQAVLMLSSAQVAPFAQIKSMLYFVTSITDEIIMSELSRHAWLVHGNWVVKSELVYPKNAKSQITGCSGDKLRTIRDMFIHSIHTMDNIKAHEVVEDPFAYNPEVLAHDFYPPFIGTHYRDSAGDMPSKPMGRLHRPEHNAQVYIRVKDMRVGVVEDVDVRDFREVFKGPGRHVISKGWTLKRATDQTFIDAHPDIVREQNALIEATLGKAGSDVVVKKESGRQTTPTKPKREPAIKKEATAARHPKTATPEKAHKEFAKPAAVTEAERLEKHQAEELKFKTHRAALIAHIEALLVEHGVLSYAAVKALCASATKKEFKADGKAVFLALKAGGLSVTLEWWDGLDEDAGNKTVYVAKSVGDPAKDEYRNVLLECFQLAESVKKSTVDAICTERSIAIPATTTFTRMVKEIAKKSGGAWSFMIPEAEIEDEDEEE
ncbi:hypothetical protein SARC_03189 [Sphaeroforma arctica JP610]|uniref:Uncharacterized protein n=1 Tax=Sphaeroforma arctica JP610 TaxID=667725 RepID=A0A0L0G6H7_9EUKA|nr:hypothetical protein SARC_03189 [Sphaeroforma arctica JP610]KNC84592.1 hypothetical protein SARC_03189 [Sphaeroforma arctica JP610]|eukprot:XP_014158494.1 hypothetical protein SARC_03189 [Sphaeroforma arctica JP610]